jgi:hypothetical protein
MPLVETLPVDAEHLGSASGRPDVEAPALSSVVRGLPELAMTASEPTAAEGRQS